MEFNSRVSWVQYCIEESTRWKNNRIILILDSKEKKETYFKGFFFYVKALFLFVPFTGNTRRKVGAH